jgi:hypothetical protein
VAIQKRTDDELTAGLLAMAVHLNRSKDAENALKAQGLDIPAATLRSWVKRYPERYEEVRRANQAAIEDIYRSGLLATAREAHEAISMGVKEAVKQLKTERVHNAAQWTQQMASTTKLLVEELKTLEGKPAEHVHTIRTDARENLAETMQKLGLVVEGTAEEIPPVPAQLEAETGDH